MFLSTGAFVKGEDYFAIYKGKKQLSVNELVEMQIIAFGIYLRGERTPYSKIYHHMYINQ